MKREYVTRQAILKYWYLYVVSITFLVIGILLDMLVPQIIQRLIDDVIVAGNVAIAMRLVLGMLWIGIGRAICSYIKEWCADYAGISITTEIRKRLFYYIQTLDMKFFEKNNTGQLMARVKDDTATIGASAGFIGVLVIESALHTCFVLFCMFRISPLLTVIPLIVLPFVGYSALKLEKKLDEAFENISQTNADITTIAQENLSGVRTVKAFAREEYEINKFQTLNKNYRKFYMKRAKSLAKYDPRIVFYSKIMVVVILMLGGVLVINNRITIGSLGAFIEYANNIIWPMEILGWLCNELASASASNKKIKQILAYEPEIKNGNEPKKLPEITGEIAFENVNFSINGKSILKDVSFQIGQGKTLGIMGATGSGKSTIIQLLERFYDVDSGRITLDGVDIRELDLHQLRTSISLVMQDVFLFSDTIHENIIIGQKETLTRAHVEEACVAASANHFVENLQEQYDTVIGERGVGLSGGQKQRISIARTLAKDCPIMVFDDATSALDMETEKQVQKALFEKKDSTKIIIAHRVSAVQKADYILVLNKGEIVEQGTHNQLLQQKGMYYTTYNAQYGKGGASIGC